MTRASKQRRSFITLLGGAAASSVAPRGTRAQQSATRVVGGLIGTTQAAAEPGMPALRQALAAHGYVEGRNLVLDLRYADGQQDRLPALAAALLSRPVEVIFSFGAFNNGTLAVRALNPTIPIVFYAAVDPERGGMVLSLNRPGGDITGVFVADLGSKRLGLLHELLPHASSIGVLANPTSPAASMTEAAEIQGAADTLGLQIRRYTASTERETLAAFESMAQERTEALLVTVNPFFAGIARQIVALAERFAIPTLYGGVGRFYAAAGGLISYNSSVPEAFRIVGDYVGRILKGAKAGDLPVQRPTKFELIINLKTAKALNLAIPNTLLAIADEVIE